MFKRFTSKNIMLFLEKAKKDLMEEKELFEARLQQLNYERGRIDEKVSDTKENILFNEKLTKKLNEF